MTLSDPIVIISGVRTAVGAFQGALQSQTASQLGAAAIGAAVARARLSGEDIDEVLMGCVLPAGQGQAPARQAALAAGLPLSCAATTINKMCGSGMKAAMLAHDLLVAGSARVAVAGGMESMSNAPYLLPRVCAGYRMGHGHVVDHMFLDGLEDAYDRDADGGRRLMGTFAEDCAKALGITREVQDSFALTSLGRAQHAINAGLFDAEVIPVQVTGREGAAAVVHDEQPLSARPEKVPHLRPAFRADGTVTAANASSISDGAAALVMMRISEAQRRGLTPLAVIRAPATHAQEPAQFPTAPVGAMKQVADKAGWALENVDLFEINEAFAVVPLAAMRALDLPHDKVNVNGGACALGHPIGASGARVLVTLLAALRQQGQRRGIASLCIGGGEATAMAVETLG